MEELEMLLLKLNNLTTSYFHQRAERSRNATKALFLWSKPFLMNEVRSRMWSQQFRPGLKPVRSKRILTLRIFMYIYESLTAYSTHLVELLNWGTTFKSLRFWLQLAAVSYNLGILSGLASSTNE